jgi:hypothetical protein
MEILASTQGRQTLMHPGEKPAMVFLPARSHREAFARHGAVTNKRSQQVGHIFVRAEPRRQVPGGGPSLWQMPADGDQVARGVELAGGFHTGKRTDFVIVGERDRKAVFERDLYTVAAAGRTTPVARLDLELQGRPVQGVNIITGAHFPDRFLRPVGHGDARILVDTHDAVGLLEDLGHDGVGQGPFGAVLAVDVIGNQNHRAGAIQGVGGDEVLDAVRPHLHQQVLHAARFELEDALGPAAGEDLEGLGVVQVELVQVEVEAVPVPDQGAGAFEDAERLEAQEVHLEQAHLLDHGPFVLGNDVVRVRGLVQGHEIRQRLVGDDHAGRMDRGVPSEPFELAADVDDFARQLVRVVRLLELRLRVQGLVERHVQRERHELGQPVRLHQRHAEDPADVADDGLRLHRPVGDNLGDVAVLAAHVLDDLLAVDLAHVDIDIGHLVAGRVHEALEEQAVADRIHVAQAQAITHERADAAAPGPQRNVLRPGIIAEIPHDEEVAREALRLDHGQLAVEPLLHLRRDAAVAFLRTFAAQGREILFG